MNAARIRGATYCWLGAEITGLARRKSSIAAFSGFGLPVAAAAEYFAAPR